MNVWCVARNYKNHALELGNDVPKEPLFFLKSTDCIHYRPTLFTPSGVKSLHYELEVALKLDSELKPSKVALALDLTDRSSQSDAKKSGEPWTLAKSFIDSCPLSPWIDHLFEEYVLELWIDGQLKQKASTREMIFNWDQLIAYLKIHFPLRPGDIVLTGTPSGVGPLSVGNQLSASLKTSGLKSNEKVLLEWHTHIQ